MHNGLQVTATELHAAILDCVAADARLCEILVLRGGAACGCFTGACGRRATSTSS